MISSNQKFVHHIGKKYKHCVKYYDDLISAGNVGMVKAARRYDPNRGVKFTTYAYYWIRKEMLELCKMEYTHGNTLSISQEIIENYSEHYNTSVDITQDDLETFLVYLLPIERIVIKMKYINNFSLKTIALRTQISYNHVISIHDTALSKLRKVIF